MKHWIKRVLATSPLDLYRGIKRSAKSITGLRISRFDPSDYIVISPGARWGNLLYFLLQAEITGKRVLLPNEMQHTAWLKRFPGFKEHVVYLNAETDLWPTDYYQFLGESFTYEELQAFVKRHFLDRPEIEASRQQYHTGDPLFVNIRRGDFYSVQQNEMYYGYDIVGFLKYCFGHYGMGRLEKIAVVSDDIGWCKANLQFLHAYTDELVFLDLPPAEAFFVLSTAKRLVISNSTFTYWAAYVSTFLYGEDSEIYAPDFVCRVPGYEGNKQYLPQWRVIEGFDCNSSEYLLSLIGRSYGQAPGRRITRRQS